MVMRSCSVEIGPRGLFFDSSQVMEKLILLAGGMVEAVIPNTAFRSWEQSRRNMQWDQKPQLRRK